MNSIKNNRPKRNSGFVQGYMAINECQKYQGKGPIIFRSSWERKFCLYCERTPAIKWWSSESLVVKYFSPLDNKYHNYFPDFLVHLEDGSTVIVEVKPKVQLIKPEPPKRKTRKSLESYKWLFTEYVKNMAKKAAAEDFAKARNWKFMIVTEDFFTDK